MKTHKCRPVLIETKEPSTIGKLKYGNNKLILYPHPIKENNGDGNGTELQQLILISLENEIIIEGDKVLRTGQIFEVCDNKAYLNTSFITAKYCNEYNIPKAIATQEQLAPELIKQLLDGGMKDFEIEMELDEDLALKQIRCDNPKFMTSAFVPKLTNGFVTIVEKEFPVINFKNATLQDMYDRGFPKNNILYTEEEVGALLLRFAEDCDRGVRQYNDLKEWFNQNKKK